MVFTYLGLLQPEPSQPGLAAAEFVKSFGKFVESVPLSHPRIAKGLPLIHRQLIVNDPIALSSAKKLQKDFYIGAFTLGKWEGGEPKRFTPMVKHWNLEAVPDAWFKSSADAFQTMKNFRSRVLIPSAKAMYSSEILTKEYRSTFTAGHPVTITLRKVFTNRRECLNCHGDVKPGQPIGLVGIARIPKVSQRSS